MGLAAGVLMSMNGIEDGVELLDLKFIYPFDPEVGCAMICNHYYGVGMEFHSELPRGDILMVASIDSIYTRLSAPILELLDDLKHHHTREVMNIQEHYCVFGLN